MGEPSLKSHVQGKKHQSILPRSEKNPSVVGFWKKEQVAEASTSKESGKPSTLVMSSSGEQKSSLLTKFPLTKETPQGRNYMGIEIHHVSLLLQFSSCYYRCFQSYVSQ